MNNETEQPYRVGLVSCSKTKVRGVWPARELYSASWVFARSVQYVEAHCDEWLILSARHGLVEPTKILHWYDDTLGNSAARQAWGRQVRSDLEARYGGRLMRYIVMAGAAYAGALRGLEAEIEEPLKGLGTGKRRQWLAEHT